MSKTNTKAKKENDVDLPRGDGEWARKSLLKFVFYYTWLKLDRKYHLVLIQDEPKGFQKGPKVNTEEGESPEGLRMAQKTIFGQHFLLFLDGPAKNQQAFISIKCPKTR